LQFCLYNKTFKPHATLLVTAIAETIICPLIPKQITALWNWLYFSCNGDSGRMPPMTPTSDHGPNPLPFHMSSRLQWYCFSGILGNSLDIWYKVLGISVDDIGTNVDKTCQLSVIDTTHVFASNNEEFLPLNHEIIQRLTIHLIRIYCGHSESKPSLPLQSHIVFLVVCCSTGIMSFSGWPKSACAQTGHHLHEPAC
jgi:hypothetical protein